MLTSLALVFLCGMLLGRFFKLIGLPNLLGMLITGIILGPNMLNLLESNILLVSADLRQLALIIILTRAGFSLDTNDLKKVGRPAILMCFIPACFEIIGVMMLAPVILNISVVEAVIMGAVVAAVSPAVIVPKMLLLMEKGYGTNKSIPQMIMAGASVDDVFVIVIFTAAVGLAQGKTILALGLLQIPVSIVTGIIFGMILGQVLIVFFQKVHIRDSSKVIILLSISFLLVAFENIGIMPFSGLLAIMSIGIAIQKRSPIVATRLSKKCSKLWIGAEVVLFVLVGASVNLNYVFASGISTVIVVIGALLFRMFGVFVCTLKTNISIKERIFCMIAYLPKATVQTAIGSLPLAMGLPCGNIVLTVAVLAILITAPLGALGIDLTYKKLLSYQETTNNQTI